ncbi:MAG: hypothetical protein EHM45_21055 [Desulfobacteraceae bacterium]|nr:MAG: hypothetical protein EHM45_21055 [Desulfobacteraceae bacterium]
MKKGRVIFILAVLSIFSLSIFAAAFKPYPQAKLHEKATRDGMEIAAQMKQNIKIEVYTTDESFEKVYEFYKGAAAEYKMPYHTPEGTKLPTGQILKEAFFIFDGAKDLAASKLWIKIQRPAVGLTKEDLQKNTIRDVTVITVSVK